MKDIDFDELDRAVSSLMGKPASNPDNSSKPATTPTAESDKKPAVSTPPSFESSDETAAERTADTTSTSVTPPTAPSGTRPLPRSSGRFMDVVTKSAKSTPQVNASQSREGVAITPPTDSGEPEAVADPTPASTTSPVSISSVDAEPATTPFLPNAKVEKRPLGSASSTGSQDKPTMSTVHKTESEQPDSQPPELDTAVVAVESNESESVPASTLPAAAVDVSDAVHDASHDHPDTFDKPLLSSRWATANQPPSEATPDDDESHAAIYDTSAFSQPLAHPPKAKSGWLWVVWIVLLLALGSGGAIALYYAGII